MNKKIIMVVDDDKDIREMMSMAITMENYDVVTAKDGKDALEQLKNNLKPCLILLDLMMPVMSGREFIEHIEKDPELLQLNIPIVIITAFSYTSENPLVKKVIKKPPEIEQIFEICKKYCSGTSSTY